jgi:diguanylate cyclase (GGDEF)-like protein/PAS domain S-box-containing protein
MAKGKLLIAEDEKIIAFDLSTRLSGFGYEVIGSAATGKEVLEIAKANRPDLVLMDIFLKGDLDGIQTAQALRKEFFLPVIFLTAHSDEETLQRAKVVEPSGYILKPFDDRELRSVLEMALYKVEAERRLYESEARYRAIVQDQSDLVLRWLPNFMITYANQPLCHLFNASEEQIIGGSFLGYIDPEMAADVSAQIRASSQEHPSLLFESPLTLPNANQIWVQWKGQVLFDHTGAISEIQSVGRDISEARRLQESLRESNERYLLATEGSNDGIWDYDLRGNHLFVSPRLIEILGYADDGLFRQPQTAISIVHPDDLDNFNQAIADHLSHKTPYLRLDCRLRRMDQTYGWFAVRGLAVHQPGLPAHRIAGSIMDINREKEFQDQLSYKAFHDALTGLANRSLFLNRLQHTLDRYRWPRQGLAAVLFLDLDYFKLVNDGFGHQAGDSLLIKTAHRIEECLRPGDTVARFGGDEFAILVEDIITIDDAIIIADRIQQQLSKPFQIEDHSIYVSASIGIATTASAPANTDSILRNADIAMYRAKERGRGRYVIFDPNMHNEVLSHMERDRDLRNAILNNELILHYQPVLSLTEKRIIGLEALIRWQHPQLGMLYPRDFLDSIVESSLTEQITSWILDTTCAHLSQVQAAGYPDMNVAVNMSNAQLSLPSLLTLIQKSLQTSAIAPEHLEIEITESVTIEHMNRLRQVFEKINALGVSISVNEYGCRYSFLEDLERLNVKRLRLGKDYLGWANKERSRFFEHVLISLSRAFNLELVVGHVETTDQLKYLRAESCDLFQGKLVSEPIASEDLLNFLNNQQESLRGLL